MKIAIIGTGISGLGAGYLLHPHHEITVYEKNATPGGHSRTVEVTLEGETLPVDTGFIVFNHRNYPLLTGLFKHLGVETAPSDMSFGVSINHGWLEYGSRQLPNMFAQKRNLLRPQYWKMLADIMRFNTQAERYLDSDLSLGEALREMRMGRWFRDYYLLAMGGAIWSTSLEEMEAYPARSFIRFFKNHGLLTVTQQPQWHTVVGGSREYVKKLTASFADRIRLNTPVARVEREPGDIVVTDAYGQSERYDRVIFACHADEALALLHHPTRQERQWLRAFRYQPNEAVLHTDSSFMPQREAAWSSWVYLSEQKQDRQPVVSLSYWMNNLQPLPTETPVIVTLNPGRSPKPETILDRHRFAHPVFDEAAVEAQAHRDEVSGADRIWYAGAYQRYGFHEDGLMSAVHIAQQLGIELPWN